MQFETLEGLEEEKKNLETFKAEVDRFYRTVVLPFKSIFDGLSEHEREKKRSEGNTIIRTFNERKAAVKHREGSLITIYDFRSLELILHRNFEEHRAWSDDWP